MQLPQEARDRAKWLQHGRHMQGVPGHRVDSCHMDERKPRRRCSTAAATYDKQIARLDGILEEHGGWSRLAGRAGIDLTASATRARSASNWAGCSKHSVRGLRRRDTHRDTPRRRLARSRPEAGRSWAWPAARRAGRPSPIWRTPAPRCSSAASSCMAGMACE